MNMPNSNLERGFDLKSILRGLGINVQSGDQQTTEQLVKSMRRGQARRYNESDGTLGYVDCKECRNRGDFMRYDEETDTIVVRRCKCMEVRRMAAIIEASGLKDRMQQCTFDNFSTAQPWQRKLKESAQDFVRHSAGNWFYAGGQVGCGKTHICTAIVGAFLRESVPSRYMLWREEVVRIKQAIVNDAAYVAIVKELKEIPVLYIDDFFKVKTGEKPSAADVNVAFEILNYRYNKNDLVTIISSEYTIDALLKIDEAVGSRIYERSKDYCNVVEKDIRKNMRIR